LLILIGAFGPDWATRLGGLFFTPVMLGAIFMVHIKNGWNSINMGTGNMGMGMEFQFTLLCISLFFFFRGNDVKTVA
jgi:putative oxidoreductase